ncbi:hypothetical protein [Aporhodopirellula aestuarii]|uniref:Uncharacterized protein n=1 Tax=Aporhodopirellula aestuarii TaxID=2950107 RepID=A0ABT0UA02_9BACT|nr:hypothetical protein [Aporhodopirellula aestuarii]MCM2373728.1 hypothetical protein [Aporhodopirellula aestuarii]
MEFLPLLKSHLKSDVMLDLLETWDAQVVYEYDRTHENMPDEYWASIHGEGVCFKFNEDQILDCIFLHLTDTDGFTPIDLSSTDIPQFESLADAAAYANKSKLRVSSGQGELFGQLRDWIRLEYDDHWIHYEFRDGNLGLVTLTGI